MALIGLFFFWLYGVFVMLLAQLIASGHQPNGWFSVLVWPVYVPAMWVHSIMPKSIPRITRSFSK